MDAIGQFINDPLVAPLYGLIVVAVIGMILGVFRAIQQGAFDWKKLPGILDSTVLKKVVPLAGLGVASFLVVDPPSKTALTIAYMGGCATAYAAEVKALIEKVVGQFTATTTEQDKGLIVTIAP